MSNQEDTITVGCIERHATVYSTFEEYNNAKRSKSKMKKNPDIDAKYVCLMGVYVKQGWFFEMDWKKIYRHGDTDFDGIKKYITQQIELRQKPSLKQKATKAKV